MVLSHHTLPPTPAPPQVSVLGTPVFWSLLIALAVLELAVWIRNSDMLLPLSPDGWDKRCSTRNRGPFVWVLKLCGTSLREKCVAVNRAERSWRSEECFDIRDGDADLEFATWFFGLALAQYFLTMLPFSLLDW